MATCLVAALEESGSPVEEDVRVALFGRLGGGGDGLCGGGPRLPLSARPDRELGCAVRWHWKQAAVTAAWYTPDCVPPQALLSTFGQVCPACVVPPWLAQELHAVRRRHCNWLPRPFEAGGAAAAAAAAGVGVGGGGGGDVGVGESFGPPSSSAFRRDPLLSDSVPQPHQPGKEPLSPPELSARVARHTERSFMYRNRAQFTKELSRLFKACPSNAAKARAVESMSLYLSFLYDTCMPHMPSVKRVAAVPAVVVGRSGGAAALPPGGGGRGRKGVELLINAVSLAPGGRRSGLEQEEGRVEAAEVAAALVVVNTQPILGMPGFTSGGGSGGGGGGGDAALPSAPLVQALDATYQITSMVYVLVRSPVISIV
jgi:hypothetical protein